MITKTDLFAFAKALARDYVLPAALKSAVYAVLGGVVFFIAGLLVYLFGLAPLLQGTYFVLSLLAGVITVTVYTALGALIGLALGATSTIAKTLPAAEQKVHQMLNPVMGAVIEKIPVGQVGIPIEQFNQIVEGKFSDLLKPPEQSSRLFSAINFGGRIIMRRLLAITRAVLLVNFVQSLQANGESRVTTQAVEKFARERLMGLVTNYARLQLFSARRIPWMVAAVLLLIFPALLAVINVTVNAIRG